ncbi:MAG: HYR domain-containing protein [Chloroflexi bacterium]|nr:HYR domain-containing protein [Chloroflexota bacterium]
MLRRAATTAMTVLLLAPISAQADTVPADGDAVLPGNQGVIDLGRASTGQVITWPATFRLTCFGLSHAPPGSTITLEESGAIVPDGGSVSVTAATIGPVPASWTAPGEGCPSPAPTLTSSTPSLVTMTMPPTAGLASFTVMWSRSGATGLTGPSAMTIEVEVVTNTPPVLHLPVNQTAEATSAAGAAVSWTASASDAEDVPPPTPSCSPAAGSTFPLGTTTVTCAVSDTGALEDTGSFTVTVVDTTAPVLATMPDLALTTGSPDGATLDYGQPAYVEAVDPTPSVVCLPASGATIPLGGTTVTCTAMDASGNDSTMSFQATVTYVPPVVWSALWGEPVAVSGGTFVANPGRTIPIKVEIFANGVEQTRGAGSLAIATCGGTAIGTLALEWDARRWNAHLASGRLAGPGCYVATALLDGHAAGSFRIELRGDATPAGSDGGPKATR